MLLSAIKTKERNPKGVNLSSQIQFQIRALPEERQGACDMSLLPRRNKMLWSLQEQEPHCVRCGKCFSEPQPSGGIPQPAKSGKENVRVKNDARDAVHDSCNISSTNVSRCASDILSQSRPRSEASRRMSRSPSRAAVFHH